MALSISSTNPTAGSLVHPVDEPISIVFDKTLNPVTITESRFILYRSPYTLVPCTLDYSSTLKTVQMIPDVFLLPDTDYSILLAGGPGGIQAFDGTDIDGGNYYLNFTTAPGGLVPSGTYVSAGEYFIDSTGTAGTGTALTAVDGVFDSEWEQVYAVVPLSLLTVGEHTLYVHGKNSNSVWGDYQSITFDLTNSGPTGTKLQDTYEIHTSGPSTTNLIVSPSPTGGAPTTLLTAVITTRNLLQVPISGVVPSDTATDYLHVIGTNPVNMESLVDISSIEISFNYDLSESYNDL